MKLLTKPHYLTVKTHDPNVEQYKDKHPPKKVCKINGEKVVFTMNPSPRETKRVNFKWRSVWYFIDDPDLYALVKNSDSGSKFLEFFIEAPK